MIVSLIVARDRNGGIGKDNALPWRLSSDLKRFRALTMGHHIVVGRKTFQSIGKPLPGRTTIVITRSIDYRPADCLVAHSVDEAISIAEQRGESEVFICGGVEVFRAAFPRIDKMYITEVDAEVGADTFFPEFDETQWIEEESAHHQAAEKDQFPFTFRNLVRRAR